jgi:hypothetical protein
VDIDEGNMMEPNTFKVTHRMNSEIFYVIINVRTLDDFLWCETIRHTIRAIHIVTAFFTNFIREVFTKMSREASRKGFNEIRLKGIVSRKFAMLLLVPLES